MCGPREMHCSGGMDGNGCPMPDTCQAETRGFNGAVCPAHCPVMCGPNDLWCDGGSDCNGCKMPNTCVPNENGQASSNSGSGNGSGNCSNQKSDSFCNKKKGKC